MEASMQRDLTCYAPIGGKLKTAEYQSFGEEWIIDRALDCWVRHFIPITPSLG